MGGTKQSFTSLLCDVQYATKATFPAVTQAVDGAGCGLPLTGKVEEDNQW